MAAVSAADERGQAIKQNRMFSPMTGELEAMVAWFREKAVTHVAMEAWLWENGKVGGRDGAGKKAILQMIACTALLRGKDRIPAGLFPTVPTRFGRHLSDGQVRELDQQVHDFGTCD